MLLNKARHLGLAPPIVRGERAVVGTDGEGGYPPPFLGLDGEGGGGGGGGRGGRGGDGEAVVALHQVRVGCYSTTSSPW